MRYKAALLISVFLLNGFVNADLKKSSEGEEEDGSKTIKDGEDKTKFVASIQEVAGEVPPEFNMVQTPELEEQTEASKKYYEKLMERAVNNLRYKIIEGTEEEDEPLPPPPEIIEPELTQTQKEGKALYEAAIKLLNKTKPNREDATKLLIQAMEKGNSDAKARIAWAYLFGTTMNQNMNDAKEIFYDLAGNGHPDGHMGLGFLAATGLARMNISQSRALVHFTMAAIGGHSWAQMIMGYRYWFGITVPNSCEKSLEYYRQVAAKVSQGVSFTGGSSVQRVRLLDELENGYSSSIIDTDLIEYYELLAEKGDIKAQVGLGQLHYQGGRGLDLDYEKALHYFTQAANAGNAIAMAYLGKIYLDGSDEVKQDNDTAFKYFKKASEMNNPVGLSGLGLMYLYGRGVEKDYVKAHKYFLAAADQGWVDGQLQLGNMYLNGIGVTKDYKLANKYFSLASQSGHVLAYYNLAQMHSQGTGMMRSCTTAVELYKNVAERGRWGETLMHAHQDYRSKRFNEAFVQYALLSELGYEVAQSNTGFILDRDEVPMMSESEALSRALLYWSRSAAQGYSPAQVKLGDYHYYGLGTAVDYETAASHYRIASEQQHNAQAMFNLGYMHEQGLGMVQDMHLAKRLYDLAAETNADAKVPVSLALLKLSLMFSWQCLQESPFAIFFVSETFGNNWDLYLITALTILLAGIIYFRRPRELAV